MNPNNTPPPNSQNSNPPFPYTYPNSYFPNPQNFNSQIPNSQYQFSLSQNSQFPFSYPQNSPYQFPFPPFSNPQFETQQTPINIQNSPETQVPAFGHTNIIDLNDDCEEIEDAREITGQWKWVEDKLLKSAWLNVSIDPLIGTDQKADTFWDRIHQYCEEDNPGVIKRGAVAMRKMWQRINEGAQKFGSCYEEDERMIGSGSNMDNLLEKAHDLHLTHYKKKSNFELHWRELRRQPKWRTPTTSASSKRTKLSSSAVYSSKGNNDTPTSEEFEPLRLRPKGTKAAKRKGKGKATAVEIEEYEAHQVNELRKMSITEKINEIKQRELEAKQTEMDLQIILADTTKMNDARRKAHAKLLEKINARN